MKTMHVNPFLKITALSVLGGAWLLSCSDDDPEPINETEVITTVTVTLMPTAGGGETITLQFRDLDGDGPGTPDITVSGEFSVNTDYSGSISLLNETVSPAEDITEEVATEKEEHQFFFQTEAGLQITTSYADQDSNGNPVGLAFNLSAGEVSSGIFTVTLIHEPDKTAMGVADGNIAHAGGETDVQVSFNVSIL